MPILPVSHFRDGSETAEPPRRSMCESRRFSLSDVQPYRSDTLRHSLTISGHSRRFPPVPYAACWQHWPPPLAVHQALYVIWLKISQFGLADQRSDGIQPATFCIACRVSKRLKAFAFKIMRDHMVKRSWRRVRCVCGDRGIDSLIIGCSKLGGPVRPWQLHVHLAPF